MPQRCNNTVYIECLKDEWWELKHKDGIWLIFFLEKGTYNIFDDVIYAERLEQEPTHREMHRYNNYICESCQGLK
jgi:hypothetical protein